MRPSRVVVTGGAGFIGSTLVKRLVQQGHHVRVIDNLWRGRLENLTWPDGSEVIDRRRDFHLADLCDSGRCLELVRDVDLVYHLADVVAGIEFVFNNEAFVFRQNVVMNSNVINACVANGVSKLVYAGTACSYPKHLQGGVGTAVMVESQAYPAEPESAYGWSKLLGEYEAELAGRDGRVSVGLLRFHNVYGPGAAYDPSVSQVIPALNRKAIRHPAEPFSVWGSGRQYRDFVFADDAVEALLLVAERGMDLGVIQIGTGEPVTVRHLADLIIAVSGKDIHAEYDTSRPEGDFGRVADWSRAREILCWTPAISLREGLERSYEWVGDRLERDT